MKSSPANAVFRITFPLLIPLIFLNLDNPLNLPGLVLSPLVDTILFLGVILPRLPPPIPKLSNPAPEAILSTNLSVLLCCNKLFCI